MYGTKEGLLYNELVLSLVLKKVAANKLRLWELRVSFLEIV